jgi:hypothetical protein
MNQHDEFLQHAAEDLRRHGDSESGELGPGAVRLLEAVRPWISAGSLKVSRGNQRHFELIAACYPIGFNRIDWRGVNPHEAIDILPSQDRQTVRLSDELDRLNGVRSVVESWLSRGQANGSDPVFWVGDACDLTLQATPSAFVECYPELFVSGQHSYVIPSSCEWCINYTLEGQLFFGRSVDAVATGCIDLESSSGK